MAWPNDGGLPTWLFIVVVLLPLPLVILPILVVWRRLARRSDKQSLPFSEKSTDKIGRPSFLQQARAWCQRGKRSSPDSRFQFATRKNKRSESRKMPATVSEEGMIEEPRVSGAGSFWWNRSAYREHVNNLHRPSWLSLLRRLECRGQKDASSKSATQVDNRPSYIPKTPMIDSRSINEKEVVPTNHDMRWLDTPSAQLTPLTPLDLPWTPMSTIESIQLKNQPAGPPSRLPPLAMTRQQTMKNPTSAAERRETKKLESWLATSHGARSPSTRGARRSSAMRDSFLQTWTKVYCQYLGISAPPSPPPPLPPPKSPLPREPARAHISGQLSAACPTSAAITITSPSMATQQSRLLDNAAAPSPPDVQPATFNFMLSPLSPTIREYRDDVVPVAVSPWTTRRSMLWSPVRRSPQSPSKSWLLLGTKSPV